MNTRTVRALVRGTALICIIVLIAAAGGGYCVGRCICKKLPPANYLTNHPPHIVFQTTQQASNFVSALDAGQFDLDVVASYDCMSWRPTDEFTNHGPRLFLHPIIITNW